MQPFCCGLSSDLARGEELGGGPPRGALPRLRGRAVGNSVGKAPEWAIPKSSASSRGSRM
jgi:hypothetical protein